MISGSRAMSCDVLSSSDLEQIHQTSMKLLENVGVMFPHEEALAAFKQHGVKVDGQRVYPTETQVMNVLKTVPTSFTLHARNPQRNVTVGNGSAIFVPGYGAPFLIDAERCKREPTMQDYHNLVMLAQA